LHYLYANIGKQEICQNFIALYQEYSALFHLSGSFARLGLSRKHLYALSLVLVFFCLDAVCSFAPDLASAHAAYFFQIAAPIIALVVCTLRTFAVKGRGRTLWSLLALSLFLWSCGIGLSAWEDLFHLVPFDVASLSDFVLFFYGVPIMIALSTPSEGQQLSLFFALDWLLAAFAACLAYIAIFAALPFSSLAIQPISGSLLVVTYNVENTVLAAIATLRLASTRRSNEHRFYRILWIFLVAYGGGAAVYNYLVMANGGNTNWNILVDTPFILLALLIALLPDNRSDKAKTILPESTVGLFIDNASPIFFPLALFALGMVVLRNHFVAGAIAIGIGMASYSIRTTLLQIRYIQAQRELKAARDRLEEISLQDSLTGIANRRSFDRTLESEWHRAMRTRHPLSLLIIDLDHFKYLNDRHGHPYGDKCLIEVAHALRGTAARSGDLVARYGGEEFGAILPSTSGDHAEVIAERMQAAVAALKIENETEVGKYLSISIGISSYTFPETGSPAALIDASDRALYKAKQSGRNRIEVASMQPVTNSSLTL